MPPSDAQSVFINCPYDGPFEPLFHAIVLTVVARGFRPRCARETEGEASPRIARILEGLRQSRYSIHDLSRFQGEGPENLARFNMPLELGIALGFRHLGETAAIKAGNLPAEMVTSGTLCPQHNWLALVPHGFVHQKFISDLAGYDVPSHDQTPAMVISRVAAWLSKQPDFTLPTPPAKAILGAYPEFCELLKRTRDAALGELTWPEILQAAALIASALPVAGAPV
jgi:hypothetical protein